EADETRRSGSARVGRSRVMAITSGKRGRESETAACERLPLLCQLCARTSRQEARLPVRIGFLGSREFGMRDIRAWKVARLDKPTNAASAGAVTVEASLSGLPGWGG